MNINLRSRVFRFLFASALAGASSLARAQAPDMKEPAQAAMRDVAALAGEWSGSGWSMTPEQVGETTTVTESVAYKLDETVLLLQARGLDESGEASLHALAVLYYDPFEQKYRMDSHLSSGLAMAASFEVIEANSQFRSGFEAPTGALRYRIALSDGGAVWRETGEYSPDESQWFPIMEMTLRKQ